MYLLKRLSQCEIFENILLPFLLIKYCVIYNNYEKLS